MVVRGTLHSFKVEALNIYSMDNTISYSFDPDLIGRKNFGGTGYQQALEGKITSRLVQRGNFFEISLGFPKEARLITYAPLRAEPELSESPARCWVWLKSYRIYQRIIRPFSESRYWL